MTRQAAHIPVMLEEVMGAMRPADGEIYVDGTFGAGGYSAALLEAAQCTVYAIDRDPDVEQFAEQLRARFPGRFFLLAGQFGDMLDLLAAEGVRRVHGIVLDLGASSMQFDRAERGFSFQQDGPLDMRMGRHGISAADIVNRADEEEIADILYRFGEERASRRIAREIARARAERPIASTRELAEIVRRAVRGGQAKKTDPATRTFQALRIAVNDELGELQRALEAAETLLAPGGRLIVVSFHSLEDRMVKTFFKSRSGKTGGVSRHLPVSPGGGAPPVFFLDSKKAVKPANEETRRNPRARSARLRRALRSGG